MKIYDSIIANGSVVCYNSLASRVSNFGSGGAIHTLIEPTSLAALLFALENLNSNYVILGNGTNTLIDDNGYNGVIISTRKVKNVNIIGNNITACCGDGLTVVANIARKNSLSGMEELAMIPGSIGGAIYMNAGAYGHNISDIIYSVTAYKKGVGIIKLLPNELNMGYRDSIFMHDNSLIILECELKLNSINKVLIANKMQELASKRRCSQPDLPSLGSVFKKVGTTSAGYYIEMAGMKGVNIGGAEISTKHANFIVNKGNATSSDYKSLVALAKAEVKNICNVELEQEVIFL